MSSSRSTVERVAWRAPQLALIAYMRTVRTQAVLTSGRCCSLTVCIGSCAQLKQDVIEILPGFYSGGMPASASNFVADDLPIAQCPNPVGCLGGIGYGNFSCNTGHAGLLCGVCALGHYGDRRECIDCDADASDRMSPETSMALVGGLFVLIFLGLSSYICSGAHSGQRVTKKRRKRSKKDDERPRSHRWAAFMRLLPLLPKRLVGASTMFRILIAYCQCMAVVLTLNNVAWPSGFVSFVEMLEVATIEIFALVPAECAMNTR
jgi:hypothetical protein